MSPQLGTPNHGEHPAWSRSGVRFHCAIAVKDELESIFRDYLRHRLRLLKAHSTGYHHPSDGYFLEGELTLVFRPRDLDDHEVEKYSLSDFALWKNRELLPILHAVVEGHQNGIFGYGKIMPIRGRWVPPVAWFIPQAGRSELGQVQKDDLTQLAQWLENRLRSCPWPQSLEDKTFMNALRDVLEERNVSSFHRLMNAEKERPPSNDAPSSDQVTFLGLLTEAELIDHYRGVFRFQTVPIGEARKLGIEARDGIALKVDSLWMDDLFPDLARPSIQELWDSTTEDTKTTPLVVLSPNVPDPTAKPSRASVTVRWIGVHEDQPFLFVQAISQLPLDQGYFFVHPGGDRALFTRKRAFTKFVGEHPTFDAYLNVPGKSLPFTTNPQLREDLVNRILETRGIFAVQGPPGTGKTYLATEVIRQFLLDNPDGRVLVCAKEHDALDHILRTTTSALERDGTVFRAFRSVSSARLHRGLVKVDSRFLKNEIGKELANLDWDVNAQSWKRFQAATLEQFDLRITSLAEAASTLFFCTTMDASLASFLGTTGFDLVVVEEAGKCYPSELLHALCLGSTVLMIGDQRQLPPYQEKLTREGLDSWQKLLQMTGRDKLLKAAAVERFSSTFPLLESLFRQTGPLNEAQYRWLRPFEHLFERLPTRHRLEEQFRMEAPLSRLIGKVFYDRPFEHCKPSSDPMPGILPADLDVPLLWIDTPHVTQMPQAAEDQGKQELRNNPYELQVIVEYLKRLIPKGPLDFVILTPYNAQKDLLLASPELRRICSSFSQLSMQELVKTTDEYQGREADLTILSLVRNNSLGAKAWGFLSEPERLNVMFSRARYRQVVVGCSAHILRHQAAVPILHAVWREYQATTQDPRAARIMASKEFVCHG